jgi:hypothetical protein
LLAPIGSDAQRTDAKNAKGVGVAVTHVGADFLFQVCQVHEDSFPEDRSGGARGHGDAHLVASTWRVRQQPVERTVECPEGCKEYCTQRAEIYRSENKQHRTRPPGLREDTRAAQRRRQLSLQMMQQSVPNWHFPETVSSGNHLLPM